MRFLFLLLILVTTVIARSRPTQHTYVPLPKKQVGIYTLLADDYEEGFDTNATDWEPLLHPYMQEAPNVLYFTFINPENMIVPPSFQKLAATRGTGAVGSVPADTVILFALGGYAYSVKINPWPFLTSREAAQEMAVKVAAWPDLYGCDGIDLDIEEGAGETVESGANMIHFINKIKELNPNMIISQPVYGYPQIQAEIDVVNHSWDADGTPLGLAQAIGIMVYHSTSSLKYVANYADASTKPDSHPIKVDVPRNSILLGCSGSASSSAVHTLANEAVKQDLMGVMVWMASVINGFSYGGDGDASTSPTTIQALIEARAILDP